MWAGSTALVGSMNLHGVVHGDGAYRNSTYPPANDLALRPPSCVVGKTPK